MTSTLVVLWSQKESASKIQVPFADVFKMYKQGMDGVDLVNQRTTAYNMDHKSSVSSCLRVVFHLMNKALTKSFIACNMMLQNVITLLDFKMTTLASPYLVGRYTNRSTAPLKNKTEWKRKCWNQHDLSNLLTHLQEFQHSHKPYSHCFKEGSVRKTYIRCTKCSFFLCLVKEGNDFLKHHSKRLVEKSKMLSQSKNFIQFMRYSL